MVALYSKIYTAITIDTKKHFKKIKRLQEYKLTKQGPKCRRIF
jgi:hypothetical protein